MGWPKTILHEIFGLFVEDGGFAITILLWLGGMWLFLSRLDLFPQWSGLILFVGLGLILVESAMRYAKRSGQTKSGR
jgi:hypothetical protein